MNVDVKDCGDLKKELSFEIPADIISKELNRAYSDIKKNANLRGFRKGKIPKQLLRVHFGKTVQKEVLEDIIPKYYKEALEEADLSPIGQPKFLDEPEIKEGESLPLKMEITVKPKIELKDYKGIELEKKSTIIDDKKVEEAILALRKQNAVLISIENRAVQKGDGLLVDYECSDNNKIFSKENHFIDLEKYDFFEDHLVGMELNKEKEFEINLPDTFWEQELQNKTVTFKVKLKEIKEKKLPEVDDEFAKDCGDYENLAALKSSLFDNLKKNQEYVDKQNLEEDLINKILEKNPIEDTLIEPIVKYQIDTISSKLSMTPDEIEKKFREKIIKDVKTTLILEQVAKREEIKIDEDEIDYEIVNRARQLNMDYQRVKEKLDESPDALEELKNEILIRKSQKFLLDNANIKESQESSEESGE